MFEIRVLRIIFERERETEDGNNVLNLWTNSTSLSSEGCIPELCVFFTLNVCDGCWMHLLLES